MSLDLEQIAQVAKLARLEVTDAQAAGYAEQLSAILEMVDQLQTADTTGVVPMAHPFGMTQRLRADSATEPDNRANFQALAPAVEDGLYLVPKVIE
ncbi:MAG: Asp-tRNA(Asn)/Glu-tRNA(Gln) amidotransferase subunit GatC [Sinobacteraceae bacterium]|nr:Asp-tRNA(Asn)/Glu-tRNA(Gln) amidotransferase subunit GatC [Nevskiaceae bacterium]